jgi:hypothetical protein
MVSNTYRQTVIVRIYGMFDPIDKSLRYVGRTIHKLVERLSDHVASPVNDGMREWIRELASLGLRPTIETIEVTPMRGAAGRERYWIRRYRLAGLLNFQHN